MSEIVLSWPPCSRCSKRVNVAEAPVKGVLNDLVPADFKASAGRACAAPGGAARAQARPGWGAFSRKIFSFLLDECVG